MGSEGSAERTRSSKMDTGREVFLRPRRALFSLILVILCLSVFQPIMGTSTAAASGTYVTVDPNKVVASNALSLGYQLDLWDAHFFMSNSLSPTLPDLAQSASLKLVRLYDFGSPTYSPATSWNESTRTGTFDWTYVDQLVGKIFQVGSQPLFCMGSYGSGGFKRPPGMAVNPLTNFPYPSSYAAYTSEWVRHFRSVGLPVRYYEIVNEPWTYFGWDPVNYAELANYMELFNAAAASMRQESSNLSISFDFVTRKPVLDYWLANGGADVDSLNFHKYDSYYDSQYDDSQLFTLAETEYFGQWPMGYSVEQARQLWFDARGKWLPVMNSESNIDSTSDNGTDPRIQQMAGAVWSALVIRMEVLSGVVYNVYYSLLGSSSYGSTTQNGGAGFGMIDSDNNHPWYPYFVQYMIGNNLGIGDPVINVTSSSHDVRTLAWTHGGKINLLLICRVSEARTVNLQGVAGEATFLKIDNSIPWTTPAMQSGSINTAEALTLNGYTVLLLQDLTVSTTISTSVTSTSPAITTSVNTTSTTFTLTSDTTTNSSSSTYSSSASNSSSIVSQTQSSTQSSARQTTNSTTASSSQTTTTTITSSTSAGTTVTETTTTSSTAQGPTSTITTTTSSTTVSYSTTEQTSTVTSSSTTQSTSSVTSTSTVTSLTLQQEALN